MIKTTQTSSNYKQALINNWMVVYTRSNWEKKADQLLKDQGIKTYCPTIKEKRKWADRYKMVEMPLFKSYLFVNISVHNQAKVLQTPGIINFVKHCGQPVLITTSEIDRIESIINTHTHIEVTNLKNFLVGDKIKINDGPFMDCYGEIANIQGTSVLMVMEQLGCVLTIKVDQSQVAYH